MKKNRWIVGLAAGGLILAACAPTPTATEGGPEKGSTVPECPAEGRCRAWLLFYVADPAEAAREIEPKLVTGEGQYVVVRADVVAGDYNLVVPVDAAGQAELDSVISMLSDLGVSDPVVLVVSEHHPAQTTTSHSFVTESEREGFEGEFPEAGRQVPNSPGANPWG